MPKTEMKTKRSTRKPLRDVSNGTKPSKSVTKRRNKAPVEKPLENEDDSAQLDRLLLVHSDLSSLLHQVDELVARALKSPSKIGRKEIECLTNVLSEMQSTLKPWPLRFQEALSTNFDDAENNLNHSVVGEIVNGKEDAKDLAQSPEESKFDSLISPSPLVAWRGEFNVDGGRQLFLLTPLPRPKASSSRPRDYSKSAFEKFKYDNGLQSLVAISNDEGREIKATPAKVSDFVEDERKRNIESEIISPLKFSQKKDCPLLVFTPRLKMSPPKSCVLLEPISEMTNKNNCGVRKTTPFPVGFQDLSSSENSESSSSGASEDLSLKYPELFGIKLNHNLGNERKGLESSPDWFMSPPKSCVLMEPSDEKILTDAMKNCKLPRTACVPDQLKNDPSERRNVGENKFTGLEFGENYRIVESTPMFKEPASIFRAGKRPGENTLKKELWTKFEEASTSGFRFNASGLQIANKEFLDRLEEVSADKTKPGI